MPLLSFAMHFTYLPFLNVNVGGLLRDLFQGKGGGKMNSPLSKACHKYGEIKIRSRIPVFKFSIQTQVHLIHQEFFLQKTVVVAESFFFSF